MLSLKVSVTSSEKNQCVKDSRVKYYGLKPCLNSGRTEKAVKVAELLVNHHEGKTLINTVNHQEHTPLHRAIEKRCLNMVNFLLLPHVKFNLSFKAKSNGRGVLHFAATVSGSALVYFSHSEIGGNMNIKVLI